MGTTTHINVKRTKVTTNHKVTHLYCVKYKDKKTNTYTPSKVQTPIILVTPILVKSEQSLLHTYDGP